MPHGHRPPLRRVGRPRPAGRRCTDTSPSPRSSSRGSRTPGGWRSSPPRRARTSPTRARDLGVVTAQIHARARRTRWAPTRSPRRPASALVASMRSRYAAAVALVPDARRPARPPSTASSTSVARRELAGAAADPRRLPPRPGARRARAGLGGPRLRGRAAAPARRARTARPRARDVAGMLRSFDYAAGSVGARPSPAVDATAWAAACRAAFLDGYASVAGAPDADAPALPGRSSSTRRSTRSSTRPATGPSGCRSRSAPSSGSPPRKARS